MGYQKFKVNSIYTLIVTKQMTLNVSTYHVLTVTVVIEDCLFKLIESQITMEVKQLPCVIFVF